MPRNLGSKPRASKGQRIVASLITHCAALVEAVYVLFWGRQAFEPDHADYGLPSNNREDRGAISALSEYRAVGPQL